MSDKSKSGSRKRSSDRYDSDNNEKHSVEIASPRKKTDKFTNPPSAYLLFIADQKNKLKNDNVIPKEAKDQSTFFSNLWKKVTDADKEAWHQKAAQEKLKWQKKFAQYYQEHGTWPDDESENDETEERPKKLRRKDKKKDRDPNEPKRPNSAYNIFIAAMRPIVKAEKPELSNTQIMSELAHRWSKLPPEKKEKYKKRAAEEKEKYAKEIEQYEAQKHKSKDEDEEEEEEQEGDEEENGDEGEGEGDEGEGEAEEEEDEEEEDE